MPPERVVLVETAAPVPVPPAVPLSVLVVPAPLVIDASRVELVVVVVVSGEEQDVKASAPTAIADA